MQGYEPRTIIMVEIQALYDLKEAGVLVLSTDPAEAEAQLQRLGQRIATRIDNDAMLMLAGKEREAAVINAALEKRARKNAHRLKQRK